MFIIDVSHHNGRIDWAKKSATQTDDNVVAKAKEVCEELAAEWGLTLSNVDAGTAND